MFTTRNLTVLVAAAAAAAASASAHIPLNITAISSRDGYSVLECWQLASVPNDAMSAANYALSNTTAAT